MDGGDLVGSSNKDVRDHDCLATWGCGITEITY